MSAPKHLLNDPKHIVIDSLKGLVGQNANIRLNEEYKGTSHASFACQTGCFSVTTRDELE